MEPTPDHPEPRQRNNTVLIWVALVLVLVGINLVLWYRSSQTKEKNEQLTTQIKVTDSKLQTQIKEYEDLKSSYERQSQELQKLGLSNDSLQARIAGINADLLRLRSFKANSFSDADQKRFQQRALNLETQLHKRDTEIADLKKGSEALYTETVQLKTKQTKLADTISTIAKTNEELTQKVTLASRIQASNIRVSVLTSKNKEREDDKEEFKAKRVDRLKVTFTLNRNDVTPKDTKTIYMRVLEPDGAVLNNPSIGGGTFTTDGQDAFYTQKQEVVFDNSGQRLEFVYAKGGDYKIGQHTVELYEGGALMGKTTFTLK